MPAGFQAKVFYDTLAEVQGYFAELRYIDTAMAYLEGEQASWWQHLGAGLVQPKTAHLPVKFGRTFPFTKHYDVPEDWFVLPFSDGKSDEVSDRLTDLSRQANTWATAEMDAVRQRVEPYTWPSGPTIDRDCVQPISDMVELLERRVSEDFGLLKHTIDSWRGDAADNFASNFYYPFEHTLRSQKQMLTALMGGIVSVKAIAESTQHSLMNVANAVKAALREQLQRAQATAEVERQESVMQAVIIAGGLAGILSGGYAAAGAAAGGGAGAGGALWSAAYSSVAGATQIASAAIPSDAAKEYLMKGSTAEQLSTNLGDAIEVIKRRDSDLHYVLLETVDNALAQVKALRAGPTKADGQLIPRRPDIVDGVNADNFYLP